MLNKVCSLLRIFCSCVVSVGMLLCVDVIVKSSAYDIMLMLWGGGGGVHVFVKEGGGQT